MKDKISFVTYYRFIGMLFILLCHFTAESSYPIIRMATQFFNIGVEMFIILSGFLFGSRGERIPNVVEWYKRRIARIFVPYELFVLALLVVFWKKGMNFLTLDWLFLLLGLQGSIVGVWGAEQTWFITVILICYLLTPIISHLANTYRRIVFWSFVVIPVILAFFPSCVFTIGSQVCWYATAFITGIEYRENKLSKWNINSGTIGLAATYSVRLIGKAIFDGLPIYDYIIVGYTQMVAAFSLFCITMHFFQRRECPQWIEYIAGISFEIYLYHYMFCAGPLRLFGVSGMWVIDCLVVTCVTLCVSVVANEISKKITARIKV